MIKNDVYYELFASKTVPNPDQVGYWIDLGANSKGKVIKLYNQDTEKWVKLTDATSEDAVAPFIGTNGNWWVDDRDTGVPAAGKNPYIGENNHWFIFDPLENEYIDTGIFAKGLSAYELAVKHGFEGTEEEWIASLSKASEEAAIIALGAAKRANEAADRADVATEKTEQAIDDAHAAADRNNEIANNPPKIVNEEWYVYDELTKEYKPTGVKAIGNAFSIKKEYPSVRAMEDDYDNPDILVGQFVIINTNNVEDPDDSKLYLKSIEGWKFVVDMSGARGIRGYSAYEVAVHNGFVGTEKEWVDSLSQDSKDAAAEALKAKEQVEETERQVKAAEAARVIAENNRVAAEEDRVDAEDIRIANENARKDAESKRVTAEEGRVAAENTRVSNENLRKSAETARENAEASRVSAESGRVSAENNRANQENARVASESARVENENNRKTAETARVNQENTRQSNETTRQTNETTRKNNENARIAAETKREQDTAAIIAATNTAKTEAEEATANANTQANRAKEYADHQPKIVARQWWVWDETIKDYKNTGIYATGEAGKSPIIKENYWWVYDNTIGDYVTTNIAVSPFIIELRQSSETDEWSAQAGAYDIADAAIKSNSNLLFNLRRQRGFDGVEYFTPTHYYRWNPGMGSAIKFILQDSSDYNLWSEEEIRVSLYSYPADDVYVEIVRKVVDNLTSASTSEALSANQGKVLDKQKINISALPSAISDITDVERTANGVTILSSLTRTSDGTRSIVRRDILAANASFAGVMTAADKIKLDSIATGAEVNVQSDWTATDTSSDAYIKNKPNLATVATSGSYNDLSNKPTISSLSGIPLSQKGVANGVATLDSNGTVPASQLPSYVDDVIEYPNRAAFPATGESGKVYIAADTNITYRWSGSSYVVIGSDLALGETASTAYPGDKGKKNADDIKDLNTAVVQINTDLTTKYSTTVQNDAKYLKLTGGTMTDRIHFNSTAPDTRFIDFYEGSGYLGSLGIDATKLVLNNHISGSQLQLRNDGEIWYRNQKVWYAGNDGSGSGLDADTVDGLQATSFLRRDISHTQDLNNIVTSGFVENNKNVDAKPEWHYPIKQAGVLIAGLSANFRTNQIYGTYLNRWFARGAGEAESGLDGYTDWKEFAFLDANGKVSKAIIADSANSVAWNNVASKPSWIGANKPTYTASEVGALPSGGTAVAATKLATARTINGVAFDGTANITITAAANGGNSATVGGYSNSAILTTRAAPVNIDSTDSTWNSTYNPSSGGTKPTTGYGLVTQFNNIQGGVPGNGGVYVSQLGFDAGGSVFYRNRYDTTAWSTWKQFIFNDDSRLTNARPADGGTSAACSGNAGTATKLQTARKINTIDFDGTEDIRIPCWNVGEKNASDSHNTYPVWLSMSQALGANGWPVDYGNVLTMRGLGDTQIVVEWNSYQTEPGQALGMNMFIRGRRDIISGWSTFQKVATEGSAINLYSVNTQQGITSGSYFFCNSGWFQNNRSGEGLYNAVEDLRWYAGQYGGKRWFSDGGAAFAGSVNGDQGFYKTSDIRLKSNIKSLSHSLDQILSIPTSSFTMYDKDQIGTIAQEIEKICPEVVTETIKRRSEVPDAEWETVYLKEGEEQVEYVKVKQVEYEMLSVLALEGLKLLNQKIEDLKTQLK